MSFTARTRLVNPRLGTYFSIFASLFVGVVVMLLMLEQLGMSADALRYVMLGAPLALYCLIGLAAKTEDPAEYFASGRRVPAFFTGLGIAGAAAGGIIVVTGTGLFFLNGFDAWCVVIGYVAGFVAMAVLIAPYYRKLGCYTVPSFLGRRFESPTLRLVAAALLAVPMLMMIAAELRMALLTMELLVGVPLRLATSLLVTALVASLVLGGMRSVTWTGNAQSIVSIIALLVPVSALAITLTNLPLPQMSYGPLLRQLARQEWNLGLTRPILSPMVFDLATPGLEQIARHFEVPFGSVGHTSFLLTMLSVMAGVAAAPWLLPRIGTTPGVYEARKSLGWALVAFGLIVLTMTGVAVFMRGFVFNDLVGRNATALPAWFHVLTDAGFAGVDTRAARLSIPAFSFQRDAVLFSLPIAAGYPQVALDLALAGAFAAALAASSAGIAALSALIAEDAVGGLGAEPASDRARILVARAAVAGVTLAAVLIATTVPFDPLRLLLWALALSGSAGFPVLVLAIWWKRLNRLGALAAVVAGFTTGLLAILAGEAHLFGIPSVLAGVIGIPVGFIAALIGARVSRSPDRHVLELVRDLRMPGGETLHDREMRLLRLKQRQRP